MLCHCDTVPTAALMPFFYPSVRGLVPGTFNDPVYFRWAPISLFDVANGD